MNLIESVKHEGGGYWVDPRNQGHRPMMTTWQIDSCNLANRKLLGPIGDDPRIASAILDGIDYRRSGPTRG